MIPLHDDNPTTLKPVITISLIVACSLVFLWQQSLFPAEAERAIFAFGFVPAAFFGGRAVVPEAGAVPAELAVITSMFLHGGWMHLIGNMLYLWIFRNNVEDAMGHVRFPIFYVLCGVAAALAQGFHDPNSAVPMIGASGAIGGVLGGYLLLYPRARVLVLIPLGFFTHLAFVAVHHRHAGGFPDDAAGRALGHVLELFDQPAGAETPHFLVIGEGKMNRALEIAPKDVGHEGEYDGDEALHVAGAAAEKLTVPFRQGEGIGRPVLAIDRHHVGVARQHDA